MGYERLVRSALNRQVNPDTTATLRDSLPPLPGNLNNLIAQNSHYPFPCTKTANPSKSNPCKPLWNAMFFYPKKPIHRLAILLFCGSRQDLTPDIFFRFLAFLLRCHRVQLTQSYLLSTLINHRSCTLVHSL